MARGTPREGKRGSQTISEIIRVGEDEMEQRLSFLVILLTSCALLTGPENAGMASGKTATRAGTMSKRNSVGTEQDTLGKKEQPGSEGGTAGLLIDLERKRTQAAVRGDTTFLEQNTA